MRNHDNYFDMFNRVIVPPGGVYQSDIEWSTGDHSNAVAPFPSYGPYFTSMRKVKLHYCYYETTSYK